MSARGNASCAASKSMRSAQEESENVCDVIQRIQSLSDSEKALVLQYLSHQEPTRRKSTQRQGQSPSSDGAPDLVEEETDQTLDECNQRLVLFPIMGTGDEAKFSVTHDEALSEICEILNSFLGTQSRATDESTIVTGLGATSSECGVPSQSEGKIIVAALRMMRANLELMARSQNREHSQAQGGRSLAQKMEPALRELVMNERCCNKLPASTRVLVRTSALEAYTAGVKIFFSNPDDVLLVLRPLFQRVVASKDSNTLSEMDTLERGMCTR